MTGEGKELGTRREEKSKKKKKSGKRRKFYAEETPPSFPKEGDTASGRRTLGKAAFKLGKRKSSASADARSDGG